MSIGARVLLAAGLFALPGAVDGSRAGGPVASRSTEVGRLDGVNTQKRILVLYSARERQPSLANFGPTLESALTERLGGKLDFYEEYLDTNRFALTDQYLSTFRTFLRDKYKDPPDVVVAVSLAAVGFISRYDEELFPGTPLLFVATTDRRPTYGTNIFSDTDWNGSLRLALDLQPHTKRVIVVAGVSGLDRQTLAGARQQFQTLQGRLEFTYLTGLPVEELERTVATLAPDSVIYFVSMTLDGAGRRFEGTSIVERIAAAANVPTYVQSDANIGHGVIGGRVWSSRPWGLKSAEVIVRLLGGEAPDTIPTSRVDIYNDRLDWRQLKRWNIDESLVPAGTEILFREPTLWDQHRRSIVGAIALVLLESAFIAGLLVQRARRRLVEASLRESELRFRETAEHNLRLAGRLINAQESERTRIARDLHDDFSQRLALLSIELDQLTMDADRPEAMIRRAQEASALVIEIATSVHNLSHELHPARIETLGLAASLRGLCREMASGHELSIEFEAAQIPASIPSDVALNLFRVTQEALRNIVKHSAARTAQVRVWHADGMLELQIADSGGGFSLEPAGQGLGLVSMRERVHLIGGQIVVHSQIGLGTRISVKVPVTATATDSTCTLPAADDLAASAPRMVRRA